MRRIEVIVRKTKESATLFLGFALTLFVALGSGWASDAEDEQTLLADFKKGSHVALMRHALAPGIGDPENFRLDDCSTQRNLSQTGRDQAVKIGARLKEAGIGSADVFTSQWCRCLETAELLGLGPPTPLPALNSFFRNYERQGAQTEALSSWLKNQPLEKPLILVTHQVNITAFSGIFPDSGEIVVMRRNGDGQFGVVGSIRTN
ncbi:MAG: histidine phosphatase family protein [Desulfofustis sp.]|nr:histidine phosphatase family protein [Desulfofustis sp.]